MNGPETQPGAAPRRDALIGHTGFVGSNLLRQHSFTHLYNSYNIEAIAGESFDLLVCAGVRAEKWIANADPAADRKGIDRLLQALAGARADRVVLISTVDVFASPAGVDEQSEVDIARAQPYGANRRYLELELAARFDSSVARLPGLYGLGLKKNVIHDFLKGHEMEKIDSRGVFQFYGVDRLWGDIQRTLSARLPVVHLVTEPVSVAQVASSVFDLDWVNHVATVPARYDLHTRNAELFGGSGFYIEPREAVLQGLKRFVRGEREGSNR